MFHKNEAIILLRRRILQCFLHALERAFADLTGVHINLEKRESVYVLILSFFQQHRRMNVVKESNFVINMTGDYFVINVMFL